MTEEPPGDLLDGIARTTTWPSSDVVLVVREVSIAYGPMDVLRDISFDVAAGEVVSLVGPSGSGKSSLLLALCGLLVPRTGSVIVQGREVTAAGTDERDLIRSQMFGFVFQTSDLVPELTMVENVSLPLRLGGVRARAALKQAQEQLDSLGVGHLSKRMSTQVSVGQLQRVAIARALVHRPPVVLADEPTGALDKENATLVFNALADQARGTGTAVVMVTHDVALADRAQRCLRLEDSTLTRS